MGVVNQGPSQVRCSSPTLRETSGLTPFHVSAGLRPWTDRHVAPRGLRNRGDSEAERRSQGRLAPAGRRPFAPRADARRAPVPTGVSRPERGWTFRCARRSACKRQGPRRERLCEFRRMGVWRGGGVDLIAGSAGTAPPATLSEQCERAQWHLHRAMSRAVADRPAAEATWYVRSRSRLAWWKVRSRRAGPTANVGPRRQC